MIGERSLVHFSIGPRGEVVALTKPSEKDRSLVYRAHVWTSAWHQSIDLDPIRQSLHHLQPLDAGYLAVGSEAHVFGLDGARLHSFPVAWDLADVQATSGGDVWVSYHDQGILDRSKLSREGLVRFDADGRRAWGFDTDGRLAPSMFDCYALNVAGERDVWVCYYTNFPLVHIHDGAVKDIWAETPVRGAHGLAVSGARVAFVGGYDDTTGVTVWDPFVPTPPVRYTVLDETGAPLDVRRARARGQRIVWWTDEALYEITVSELG